MDLNWTTFSGKKANIKEINQQHLSNCIWHINIFQGGEEGHLSYTLEMCWKELKERFTGQLLQYEPHINFKAEINGLIALRMLKKNLKIEHFGIYSYNIIYNDKIIGMVNSDKKLNLKQI